MMIYGGHSARLRGEPFGREDSDIDLFATEAERAALVAAINAAHPGSLTRACPSSDGTRWLLTGLPNKLSPGWRRIELVQLPAQLHAIAEALPGNGSANLYGFSCFRSDLVTDCLIKLGAIEEAPRVDPKHAEDLAQFGFTIEQAGPAHLEFYLGWRAFLAALPYN